MSATGRSASPPVGRTAGRPRDPRLQDAIALATIELLANGGYDSLTMESVAYRAGTTKTAIYRRWPSKAALVADVFATRAQAKLTYPDTGTLRGDLVAHLRSVIKSLTGEAAGRAVLELVRAAGRHPDLAALLRQGFVRTRRTVIAHILELAVDRGEAHPGVDRSLAADLILGPVYYRLLVSGEPVRPEFAGRVVDAVLPGLLVDAAPHARRTAVASETGR